MDLEWNSSNKNNEKLKDIECLLLSGKKGYAQI